MYASQEGTNREIMKKVIGSAEENMDIAIIEDSVGAVVTPLKASATTHILHV